MSEANNNSAALLGAGLYVTVINQLGEDFTYDSDKTFRGMLRSVEREFPTADSATIGGVDTYLTYPTAATYRQPDDSTGNVDLQVGDMIIRDSNSQSYELMEKPLSDEKGRSRVRLRTR